MTPEATLARFREYMVGPTRFMNLLSCFELGIIDALRDNPGMSSAALAEAVGVKPDAVDQLLNLLVKEDFVAHADGYRLAALADVPQDDLRRALAYMNLIKVVVLRQLFYLTESARTGTVVGLKQLYGHRGNLYSAVAEHADLRAAWAPLMDRVTARVDPWFFDNIDIPDGARVLDLAGNTGLGAIHAYQRNPSAGLRVTTFDLPEKQAECLANFRSHGVAEHCSFIGGDVFDHIPQGFDVVLIKHFLDMFDRDDVCRILDGVNKALNVGGRVHILVPIYPEQLTDPDNYNVDFFPAFFLGATMGQGGPQKLSTYRRWLEECRFTVTSTVALDPAERKPDVIPVPGIISATKRHKEFTMDVRLNIYQNAVSVKFLRHIRAASRAIGSALPVATRELVSLRISQINGCAFCVDMHVKEATHAGETALRLHMVSAWRETDLFTDAERAALELAEHGTRIADAAGGVTDDAWTNAAKHYDEDQLAALVSLISFMNVVNRVNVITRQQGGDYQLGWRNQFD